MAMYYSVHTQFAVPWPGLHQYHSGRLVIDANLEASETLIHKMDAVLGLGGDNGSINIFENHVIMP